MSVFVVTREIPPGIRLDVPQPDTIRPACPACPGPASPVFPSRLPRQTRVRFKKPTSC